MTRITLRLPDDLHRRLEDACRRSGTSLNRMIVAALAQALERRDASADGQSALMDQVSHIQTALREMTVEIATKHLPSQLRPERDVTGQKRPRALPTLVPPLSSTILEERREQV